MSGAYFCHILSATANEFAAVPWGTLYCESGQWRRVPVEGRNTAQCPESTSCDPLTSSNAALLNSKGMLRPTSFAPITLAATRTAPCKSGYVSLAFDMNGAVVCGASKQLMLATGGMCGKLCPAVAVQDFMVTTKYTMANGTASELTTVPPSNAQGYRVSTTVTVACALGAAMTPEFASTATVTAQCDPSLGSGQWTATLTQLVCAASNECPINALNNGTAHASVISGAIAVTYTCDTGHEFSHAHRAKNITHLCQGGGAGWGAGVTPPQCVPIPTCSATALLADTANVIESAALFAPTSDLVTPASIALLAADATNTGSYDDYNNYPCPQNAICHSAAPAAAVPPEAGFPAAAVPLGVVARPVCRSDDIALATAALTAWPTIETLSTNSALSHPHLRLPRCVRVVAPGTNASSAVWSTNAISYARRIAPVLPLLLLPVPLLACLPTPVPTATTLLADHATVTFKFSLSTTMPPHGAYLAGALSAPALPTATPIASTTAGELTASRATAVAFALEVNATTTACSAVLTPATLALLGGNTTLCGWKSDGATFAVTLGTNFNPSFTLLPLKFNSVVIAASVPNAYATVFSQPGYTALAQEDMAVTSVWPAAPAQLAATPVNMPPVLSPPPLNFTIAGPTSVDTCSELVFTAIPTSGAEGHGIKVLWELVLAAEASAAGTVTTDDDISAFSDAINAFVAQWQPSFSVFADNDFDGRWQRIVLNVSNLGLTDGAHEVRISAWNWLMVNHAPVIRTHVLTVTSSPLPRVTIAAAGARSDDAVGSDPGSFDPGQVLLVDAISSASLCSLAGMVGNAPGGDGFVSAEWAISPAPPNGATFADIVGAGAAAAARNLIIPAHSLAFATMYTLSLTVSYTDFSSGTAGDVGSATASIVLQSRSFRLVSRLTATLLRKGQTDTVATFVSRAVPVLLTSSTVQQRVVGGELQSVFTVATDMLSTYASSANDAVVHIDTSGAYDPHAATAFGSVTVGEWKCYRVLRTAAHPNDSLSTPTYETQPCSVLVSGIGAVLTSSTTLLVLTQSILSALMPAQTDGTQSATLVIANTISPSMNATTDTRRTQSLTAIALVSTLSTSVAVVYSPPAVGAIGTEAVEELATRFSLTVGSNSWAAAPLGAPLRLAAVVTARNKLYALRWICTNCGSKADPSSAFTVTKLDLTSSGIVTSGTTSSELVIAANALSPLAVYTFKLGVYETILEQFPYSQPPALPSSGDLLAGAVATATLNIYTPSAPQSGQCGYDTNAGTAALSESQNVLLYCRGWTDEPAALPLRYRWGYQALVGAETVDVLLAVTEGVSAGELRLALAPGTHVATVEILNALGGRVVVTIPNVVVPALGSSDPLATADYHVGAASDALGRLDSTAFVAAVLSAASTARATSGATTAASTAQYTHTVSSVHDYVGSDETLWLLTALENYERSVRATGDDTFIIAQRNVSSLTAVQLLAVAQGFALTDSSLTPGSDVSAGAELLAALNATEAAAVLSSHALAVFITEEIMANLAEQQVPITDTLDAAVAVASIIATYGDVKTNAVLSATSTAVSLADLMDRTLAPTAAALLQETTSTAGGTAPIAVTLRGMRYSFSRVAASEPAEGWLVRGSSVTPAAFPFTGIGGGVAVPTDNSGEASFWIPAVALSGIPSADVDVAFVARDAFGGLAYLTDSLDVSLLPPADATWGDNPQPPSMFATTAGLKLGEVNGSPSGVETELPGTVPNSTNGTHPAPVDSVNDNKLIWISVPHDSAPAAAYGIFPYAAQCRFYDTAAKTWSGAGCAVAATSSTRTLCKCSHLTIFSIGWTPFWGVPNFVRLTASSFELLTWDNLSRHPAPLISVMSLFGLAVILSIVFFFIDVRIDQAGLAELLESWDPVHQRPMDLHKEYGIERGASTIMLLWRRYLYLLRRDHLWSSTVSRPRTDNYSSQARAFAVCFMMLLTLTISGAMYREQSADSIYIAAIVSAAAVYPAVLLWHAIFDHCNADRLKRFIYHYAEQLAYLQLTGTSDYFPQEEWPALYATRRREVDEVAELIADAACWRVSPDDVEVVAIPRSAPASTTALSVTPMANRDANVSKSASPAAARGVTKVSTSNRSCSIVPLNTSNNNPKIERSSSLFASTGSATDSTVGVGQISLNGEASTIAPSSSTGSRSLASYNSNSIQSSISASCSSPTSYPLVPSSTDGEGVSSSTASPAVCLRDHISVTAASVVAAAVERGYMVRQRDRSTCSFANCISRMWIGCFCDCARSRRQPWLFRVAPLLPLDTSVAWEDYSGHVNGPSAEKKSTLVTAGMAQSSSRISDIQLLSLISIASSAGSPRPTTTPVQHEAAVDHSSATFAAARKRTESPTASAFVMPSEASPVAPSRVTQSPQGHDGKLDPDERRTRFAAAVATLSTSRTRTKGLTVADAVTPVSDDNDAERQRVVGPVAMITVNEKDQDDVPLGTGDKAIARNVDRSKNDCGEDAPIRFHVSPRLLSARLLSSTNAGVSAATGQPSLLTMIFPIDTSAASAPTKGNVANVDTSSSENSQSSSTSCPANVGGPTATVLEDSAKSVMSTTSASVINKNADSAVPCNKSGSNGVSSSKSTLATARSVGASLGSLALVRVASTQDHDWPELRQEARLHFYLRYAIDLDTEHVEQMYRRKAWEISQPRGIRFLGVVFLTLGIIACALMVIVIGLEIDIGETALSRSLRNVSERWVLATLLSIAMYVVISSPISTFMRSTVTYFVKNAIMSKSTSSNREKVQSNDTQSSSESPSSPERASSSTTSSDTSAETSTGPGVIRFGADAYDFGGDARLHGMPRPASSRRFPLIDSHANFFAPSRPISAVSSTRPSLNDEKSSGSSVNDREAVSDRNRGLSVVDGVRLRSQYSNSAVSVSGSFDDSNSHGVGSTLTGNDGGVMTGSNNNNQPWSATPISGVSDGMAPRLYIDEGLGLEYMDDNCDSIVVSPTKKKSSHLSSITSMRN